MMRVQIATRREDKQVRISFGEGTRFGEGAEFLVSMSPLEARDLATAINGACELLDTDRVWTFHLGWPVADAATIPQPQPGQEDQAKDPKGVPRG